ncbi:MFS transporter [Halothiobacillus sp.]|uniref:MFS transporter n=1 Tax=Halothiobacillus sp. TaxID=1891311 RepID=UPI00262B405E|nr:MFS transporter [Halothiobacillus sp.]MDD3576434.1 MFS transporter [Halothiobacillus sp.]MDD4966291.1 MFS transporter [Halothiobacillus sp.]
MHVNQAITYGIRPNAAQFTLQLLQVFLVGSLVGMTRTVLPELAESNFGLTAGSFLALATFVVVFGLVKALLNLFAGTLSDRWGRRRVLIAGWVSALPIPLLILYGPNWGWIILATVFLGINQGLSWSMALNSKLDLTHARQRGLVNGFNEFAGYGGVAIAGILSALAVHALGARTGLFIFTLAIIVLALLIALAAVRETRPWAMLHQGNPTIEPIGMRALFAYASWKNRSLQALNQAGLVEKFTDAMVWLFFPVFFMAKGLSLVASGSLIAIYGVVWGAGQLITGPLSDRIGRTIMIVGGMWLCGLGVVAVSLSHSIGLWGLELALIGIGMAMLYPTLGAAVADQAEPAQRASILGIYRFWRDLGYAVGGLLLGLTAQWSGGILLPFWLVGLSMAASGLWVAVVANKSQ